MTEDQNAAMKKLLEGVEPVAKPDQVKLDAPVQGAVGGVNAASVAEVNYVSGDLDPGGLVLPGDKKVLRPTDEEMQNIMAEQGVHLDSGLATALEERPGGEITTAGYADTYPTRFFFRSDVRGSINRVQSKYPWLLYSNTYWMHPPVFGHVWETRSVDFWAGGLSNGYYTGYRGKNINITVNGWDIFNAIFNDPNPPNIAWIIYGGYMWSWNGGWTSAPWGPAGSDAGHYAHCHVSYY